MKIKHMYLVTLWILEHIFALLLLDLDNFFFKYVIIVAVTGECKLVSRVK